MRKEIYIGIMAVLTLLIGIWGFNFLKGSNFLKKNSEFHSYYGNVKELAKASAVTVSGYKVGTITGIELNPDDVSRVKVTYQVDGDIRIPANAIAVIRSSSFIGGRELALEFDRLCGNGIPCMEDGGEIQSEELGLIGSMVDFSEVKPIVNTIGDSYDMLKKKMTQDTANSELYNTYKNLDATISNLARVTHSLEALIQNSNKSLSSTLNNLDAISENIASNNSKINRVISNLETTSQSFASLQLDQTMVKVDGALDKTSTTVDQIKTVAMTTNATVADLKTTIAKMNSEEGSLGLLINNQELYNNLEETSYNLNLLLQDLRLNPKRYVNLSIIGRKDKGYTLPKNDPANK